MKRSVPLRRSPTPPRRTPLARSVLRAARRRPAVSRLVRDALTERSGGWCEMRLVGCLGRASDPCHRIASGAGGRHGAAKAGHDRLANLLHGCRSCHEWTHRNVAAAERLGLMLREGDRPELEQVFLPAHGWVQLDNAGGWRLLREAP